MVQGPARELHGLGAMLTATTCGVTVLCVIYVNMPIALSCQYHRLAVAALQHKHAWSGVMQ